MRKIKRAAVRQGPTAALEVLYRAEYTGMVRLAYTLVGSNAEAEEIVQDSFVEIRGASPIWDNSPVDTCEPSW